MNPKDRATLIVSPLSIMSALSMLLLGAKGRSYSELAPLFGQLDMVKLHEQFGLMMRDAEQPVRETTSPLRQLDPWHGDSTSWRLRPYPEGRNDIQEIHLANGLFIQQGYSINPNYRQALTLNYKSELHSVDFAGNPDAAKTIINWWVREQTRDKIPEIIEDLDASVRMILVNALHFKAMWEIDFIGGLTKERDFRPNGERRSPKLTVQTMTGAGSYPYFEDNELDCRIIGIPYHGNMTTMYVLQPLDSTVEKLARLQEDLNANIINQLISRMQKVYAFVALPKMHITESTNLREFLQSMSIKGIFFPVQYDLSMIVSADQDFSPYPSDATGSLKNLDAQRAAQSNLPTPRADLTVSEIVHKVDFNIDEKGTEAAAASAAVMVKSAFRGTPAGFVPVPVFFSISISSSCPRPQMVSTVCRSSLPLSSALSFFSLASLCLTMRN
ncbi:hypothetical protein ACLKA7_015329 [Drosophila subpalustris]